MNLILTINSAPFVQTAPVFYLSLKAERQVKAILATLVILASQLSNYGLPYPDESMNEGKFQFSLVSYDVKGLYGKLAFHCNYINQITAVRWI